jgi:hypothetical protein
MSIEKLEAIIKEIRSQSAEPIGFILGGCLFDYLRQLERLSNCEIEGLENKEDDPNLVNIVEAKTLDNEFPVYKLNDDSWLIEVAPRPKALLHINYD